MTNGSYLRRTLLASSFVASVCFCIAISPAFAQQSAPRDPAEPRQGQPQPKLLPRPAGAISRKSVDEKSMRALIDQLVSCGTRLSLSSWTDAKRGIGCGRDHIVARLNEIAKESGGKLQVVVDKFDSTSERTSGKPLPLQSVYAILPGSDPKLAKTIFIVSGHYDSRPSDVMNTEADAPGADDDASGVSVSVESARLLSKAAADGKGGYRATLLFAAISGEEQGLLGGYRLLDWAKQQGYTIGGMLDDDIVGDDPSSGAPHRVRLFSAVRFTEPLEDYTHQHQTPRTESGIEYGDFGKYLTPSFLGDVARDNAEALRQLAMAPAPPTKARLTGAVTPDAKISWSADDDPERAGFEILWRETTDPRWQVYDFAASPGETVLRGVSTDNHFFAVRAVGKNGARSIAVPTEMERRPPPLPAGTKQ